MVNQPRVEPAPLDAAQLASSLAPFGHSRMLPRAAYVEPAVFDWERRHFFSGGWQCVARSEDVAAVGDQRAATLGRGGVLLVRGQDEQLRGFVNACRHRGHELLPCGSATSARAVVCPYHSWTYTLTGELRAAAGFTGETSFNPADNGLIALPVQEWHGLVFVDASGQADPLAAALAGLEPVLAPYEPERLVTRGYHDYVVEANWKVLSENYHECYHCPMIHPQFCQVSPPHSGANYSADGPWVGGWMSLRDGMDTMSLDGTSRGVNCRGLDAEQLRQVIYLNIFPNLLVSLHPDYVMTHLLTPLAADRTRIECSWAFPPEAVEQGDFDPSYAVDFWDITNRQDWQACASVQRGLSAEKAVPGLLSAEEDAVYQYVTMVGRGYRGEPVRNAGTPVRVG